MARYVIGDIQGCYKAFTLILDKIAFNPSIDVLYLVGDLVNRGPESLKVLKWLYKNQDSVVTVLGNHDIYLLGRYSDVLPPDANETIQDILTYTGSAKLIDWLRSQPLVFHDNDHILVHAGIYPKMNFNQLLVIANSISTHLKSKDYAIFLHKVYGNKPNAFTSTLDNIQQMKFVVNACTRMRYLNHADYSLDYKYKGEFSNPPQGLAPWFRTDFDPSIQKKILFGHWAALGFFHDEKVLAVDTGCAWGRYLTAFNLDTAEITQIDNSTPRE